ncbi:hypothetical protein NEMBOFW57_001553 [Staphylotrichum longicolle]|uniref:Transcription factor n=1 Tax=Staphylotrichum longicolle TaxID=669026 RepID=A0AAD4F2A8_9PEZI|nr:hypothetical protein NEMBOFW57_001553 [Staphylotrichum longicolle]
MTGRPSNRTSQTQAMPPSAARQNEYFVPRDGIDREVITSDICRYLGNDALVRPGTYEDYNSWKTRQREQEFQASYGSAMDVDYAPPAAAAANPVYAPQQPYGGAPQAGYPPATYPAQVHAATAQYGAQTGYGYAQNPPPAQYSPQPQTGADRYSAIPPPPMPASYAQDTAPFVHGSNYQATGGYATAGPNRMPPTMPITSAAPSRPYNAPTAGTPGYGAETDQYGYPVPTGNPATQGYPTDALYGRDGKRRCAAPTT